MRIWNVLQYGSVRQGASLFNSASRCNSTAVNQFQNNFYGYNREQDTEAFSRLVLSLRFAPSFVLDCEMLSCTSSMLFLNARGFCWKSAITILKGYCLWINHSSAFWNSGVRVKSILSLQEEQPICVNACKTWIWPSSIVRRVLKHLPIFHMLSAFTVENAIWFLTLDCMVIKIRTWCCLKHQ